MTRGAAWTVHTAVALAGATGLYYGWMCYFAVSDDEFSLVNDPWQPLLRSLHILVVPLLVFASGLLWRSHVWGRLRQGYRERRRSGILLALLLLPMVGSGYFLQVAVSDTACLLWKWVHGLSSCAWLLVYVAHQFTPRRRPDAR